MSQRVSIEIKDHIADVKLSRSEKMNALDDAMFEAIISAGESLASNGDVRCVVLSGEGRCFTAGLDVSSFMSANSNVNSAKLEDRTHGIANKFQQATWVWHELPVPVIAAIHGICYGGGVQISSGSDFRIVAPDTKLSIMEMRWGIIPDMSSSQLLIHYMGSGIIRELAYTNRIFSGVEAKEYGFATHLSDDPHTKAMEIAKVIANRNPYAIQAAKEMFNKAPYVSEAEGLLLESTLQDKLIGSPNQMEAVFAQMQKREAKFKNGR